MIALVTCYFQHNFGSMLQALATQRLFDTLGIENETIRIDGLRRDINRRKWGYFLRHIFDRHTVADKMATIGKLVAKFTHGKALRRSLALRDEQFSRFAEENFRLSRCYASRLELHKASSEYGAFVVGSDQLWLPSNIEADYYTLNFVKEGVDKISLATSFGVASLPKRQRLKAAEFLAGFRGISVREEGGRRLVEELTGRRATVICDPTLFFSAEQWDELLPTQRRVGAPYIFCYFLGTNPLPRTFAEELRRKTGMKIVQIRHCDSYVAEDERLADEAPFDVSPLDFVVLIRDAEFVLTDSFHATCFSLLYHKQFYTFRRYRKESCVSTNGRLDSLLKSVNAECRLIINPKNFNQNSSPFDFSKTDAALEILRCSSYEWILNTLNHSNNENENSSHRSADRWA